MTVLTGIVLLVMAVAGFNALIDPYAVVGSPRINGLSTQKPFAGDRGRVAKLHQAARIAPRGLIVGNSRPEMGLSPAHPCWPADSRPVYNVALPGLSLYQQMRYAQHAQVGGPARTIVMGVDLIDFLHRTPPADPARWPPAGAAAGGEPFAVDPWGRPAAGFGWRRISDYVAATLSLDALGHSLVTMARQGANSPTRTPSGFNPAEGIYRPIVAWEGPRVLFAQKNREIANLLNGVDWRLFADGAEWSPEFEVLRRLIGQGKAAGAATVLFINPYHAEYLLLIEQSGLWPLFDKWKRRLARLARAEGIPLWDFSLFDRHSTEAIDALPPRGKSLQWFWEPAHYRSELGDLMLQNMLRAHCPSSLAPIPHYGVRLDRWSDAQIDAHLAVQHAARDDYKASNPHVVARIQRLLESS